MSNNKVEISVIVPVYKVEKYLDKCVDSILEQTFSDFELILVDDGSPDNCGKICDAYAEKDSRVTVIHKQNGGLSDARNCGIDNCHGKYITFVDSDDYIHADYLKKLYQAAENNNADAAMCNYRKVYDDGRCLENMDHEKLSDSVYTGKEIIYKYHEYYGPFVTLTIACSKLFRKEIFEKIRFPVGRLNEDEFVFFDIYMNCNKAACISDSLYYYLQRDGSIMNSNVSEKRVMDISRFYMQRLETAEKMKDDVLYKKVAAKYCERIIYNGLANLPYNSVKRKNLIGTYRKLAVKSILNKNIDMPFLYKIYYIISWRNPFASSKIMQKLIKIKRR